MWFNQAVMLSLACMVPVAFVAGGAVLFGAMVWLGRKRREAREKGKVKP